MNLNSPTPDADKVIVKDIRFEAVVGLDAWHRLGKPQPVELEIHLTPDGGLETAAKEDSVAHTIDYGKLYKSVRGAVFDGTFASITHLYQTIRATLPETPQWYISIVLPKGVLDANNGVQMSWSGRRNGNGLVSVLQTMEVRGVECRCIVGVNSHERVEKQRLQVTISVWDLEDHRNPAILASVGMEPSPNLTYQDMVHEVVERVEGSTHETIEALATAIAQIATLGHGFDNARVLIEKPGGLSGFGASGVSIGRTKTYFENKDFWKVKRP